MAAPLPDSEPGRPRARAVRGAVTVPWALLPLLLPGAGAPLAFGVAAGRRPGPVTVVPLTAYTAAFFGFFAFILPFDVGATPGWAYTCAFLSLLACTLGATVHLFAIRRYVWAAVLRGTAEPRRAQAPRPKAVDGRGPARPDWVAAALERERRLREDARRLAEADPSLARRNGVGRPDRLRHLDDGGLVDLNHAPLEVLAELPGFTEAAARQVRERVERLGPFQSLDEVILEVAVTPGFEKHLREYAVLIP